VAESEGVAGTIDSVSGRDAPDAEEEAARPTQPLPFRQLAQISLYWLGIN
jgi:hypothetical protein